MSICPHCMQSLPEDIPDIVFCVWCGRRVSQICPYQELDTNAYIPIADNHGHWQVSCPKCGKPFKTCPTCGRLYRLDERYCLNPGCSTLLVEPSSAFPSNLGSLDCTNSAIWGGVFGDKIGPIGALTCRDDIRLLAYRYGLLVAVSPQAVLSFRWDGQNWIRVSAVPLTCRPGFQPKSLILDDGYAFVLGNQCATAISLMDAAVFREYDGVFVNQARDDKHWIILRAISGRRTEVLVVDTTMWTENAFIIDVNADEVSSVVLGNGLHISTSGQGIISIDVESGATKSYQELSGCRCIRVASSEDRLLAIGYDSQKQLCVWTIDVSNGNCTGQLLGQNAIAVFSAFADNLYVACQAAILRFDLDILTRNPYTVNLSEYAVTESDMLIISDSLGDTRLLLKRSSPGRIETSLVNPQTGAVSSIAITANSPILCVAGSKLIVASREGTDMKLRTYAYQEDI